MSKMALYAFIMPEIIAGCSIVSLILSEWHYCFFILPLLLISFYNYKNWHEQYRMNPVIDLKPTLLSNPAFWKMTFKNGHTQKIELVRYYRSSFLIIFVYKRLAETKLHTYVLFYDALPKKQYRAVAAALWS
jgi:hypothetical protein